MGTLAGTRAGNKVVAVTNVAITTIRQGPGSSNLAFKCQPRYSLVTKTTSPPCLQRNTSDTCRDGKGKRGRSLKENTNRIEIYLVTRKTSPPCLARNTSDTCRVRRGKREEMGILETEYKWNSNVFDHQNDIAAMRVK